MQRIITTLSLGVLLSTGAQAAIEYPGTCADYSAPNYIKANQDDMQKHAAIIKQRQDQLADLEAKRNALIAAMRNAQSPAARAQKQALVEDITAKINAVLASIKPEQEAADADAAAIAHIRSLPACPRR